MFLLLSICLIADPGRCRDEPVRISSDSPNTVACLRNSQSALARWQGEHPEWSVKKWRCVPQEGLPRNL